MDINPEKVIEQLYELVAKEKDYSELRRLIAQLIECLEARQKNRQHTNTDSAPKSSPPEM
jgi:hypothetical protein